MAKRYSKKRRKPGQGGGKLWLYGTHAVLSALNNENRECLRLLITEETRQKIQSALDAALSGREGDLPLSVVGRREFEAVLPSGAVHQGIALETTALPEPHLDEMLKALAQHERAVLIILDQATDPHNVGAVLRSAAAFGAAAVITTEHNAPKETATMAKAASGALEKIPLIHVTNLARAMQQMKEAGFWCIGLDGSADQDLEEARKFEKAAVILGAEGGGLRRRTAELCDVLVRIPIGPGVESLNLSNAAAITLYALSAPNARPH